MEQQEINDNYKSVEPKVRKTLTFEEYRILTTRTLPDLDLKYRGVDMLNTELTTEEHSRGNLFNSLHMTVGMSTEVGELYDCYFPKKKNMVDWVNFGEELGDICWYLANYMNLHSISVLEWVKLSHRFDKKRIETHLKKLQFFSIKDIMHLLVSKTSVLLDLDKRHFAYGKYDFKDRIRVANQIYLYILALCYKTDLNFESILYKNIHKLILRFPDKFTESNATVRDLIKERKLLEA